MLVRKLELENVKCFAHREIDFTLGGDAPHRWVVVYGDNGMGKSTLLRAIGLALVGQPALNSLMPNAAGWVRANKRQASVRIRVSKGPQDVAQGQPRVRPLELCWRLIGHRPINVNNSHVAASSIVLDPGSGSNTQADAKLFTEQVSLDEDERGWMVAGYGAFRRPAGPSSNLLTNVLPSGRAARLATLFHEQTAVFPAELWLRALHHSKSTGNLAGKRQFEVVTDVISGDLLPEGVELADVSPEGVFFKTPFASQVPMAELSDGIRTVLAITLDLLRQISQSFDLTTLVESASGSRKHRTITAEGVVLIDELDSHLHPMWQRRIGDWLHSRFPNLQFIVATHSPLIATRVSEEQGIIVRLHTKTIAKRRFVVPDVEPGVRGLTADQILTGPSFGLESTRDLLTESLIHEVHALRLAQRRGRLSARDKQRLDQLSFELDERSPAVSNHSEIEHWREEGKRLRKLATRLKKSSHP